MKEGREVIRRCTLSPLTRARGGKFEEGGGARIVRIEEADTSAMPGWRKTRLNRNIITRHNYCCPTVKIFYMVEICLQRFLLIV